MVEEGRGEEKEEGYWDEHGGEEEEWPGHSNDLAEKWLPSRRWTGKLCRRAKDLDKPGPRSQGAVSVLTSRVLHILYSIFGSVYLLVRQPLLKE